MVRRRRTEAEAEANYDQDEGGDAGYGDYQGEEDYDLGSREHGEVLEDLPSEKQCPFLVHEYREKDGRYWKYTDAPDKDRENYLSQLVSHLQESTLGLTESRNLANNAIRDSKDHIMEISTTSRGSNALETLLKHAGLGGCAMVLEAFNDSTGDRLAKASLNVYASHVLESIFKVVYRALHGEGPPAPQKEDGGDDDEDEDDEELEDDTTPEMVVESFVKLVEHSVGGATRLLADRYGTHILRGVLRLCSGLSPEDPKKGPAQKAVKVKKGKAKYKKKAAKAVGSSMTLLPSLRERLAARVEVPDRMSAVLISLIQEITQGISVTHKDALYGLLTHEQGGPAIACVFQVISTEADAERTPGFESAIPKACELHSTLVKAVIGVKSTKAMEKSVRISGLFDEEGSDMRKKKTPVSGDDRAHIEDILQSRTGSHVAEAMILSADQVTLRWIYAATYSLPGNSEAWAFHPIGNFPLQAFVAASAVRAPRVYKYLLGALSHKIGALITNQRGGVVVRLIEGAGNCDDTSVVLKIISQLGKALNLTRDSSARECALALLKVGAVKAGGANGKGGEAQGKRGRSKSQDEWKAKRKAERAAFFAQAKAERRGEEHVASVLEVVEGKDILDPTSVSVGMIGSLIFQSICNLGGVAASMYQKGFVELGGATILEVAKNPIGCHVGSAFFASRAVPNNLKNRVARSMEGYMIDLAVTKSGSRFLESMFMAVGPELRDIMAESLVPHLAKLRANFSGKFVVRSLRLELFRTSKEQWKGALYKEAKMRSEAASLLSMLSGRKKTKKTKAKKGEDEDESVSLLTDLVAGGEPKSKRTPAPLSEKQKKKAEKASRKAARAARRERKAARAARRADKPVKVEKVKKDDDDSDFESDSD